MKVLPEEVRPYKTTPVFTEETVPPGLLRQHTTKEGAWAKIVVLEGRLLYRILAPEVSEILLTSDRCGVVEPQVPHEVSPDGPVRFFVEFSNSLVHDRNRTMFRLFQVILNSRSA